MRINKKYFLHFLFGFLGTQTINAETTIVNKLRFDRSTHLAYIHFTPITPGGPNEDVAYVLMPKGCVEGETEQINFSQAEIPQDFKVTKIAITTPKLAEQNKFVDFELDQPIVSGQEDVTIEITRFYQTTYHDKEECHYCLTLKSNKPLTPNAKPVKILRDLPARKVYRVYEEVLLDPQARKNYAELRR